MQDATDILVQRLRQMQADWEATGGENGPPTIEGAMIGELIAALTDPQPLKDAYHAGKAAATTLAVAATPAEQPDQRAGGGNLQGLLSGSGASETGWRDRLQAWVDSQDCPLGIGEEGPPVLYDDVAEALAALAHPPQNSHTAAPSTDVQGGNGALHETGVSLNVGGAAEVMRGTGRFLLDRLADHEARMTSEEDAREWHGHVAPAIARFSAALGEDA